MELKKINEDEYLKFALNNEYMSIYQLPQWGTLKESTGWIRHLVGLYDDKNTLMGVTMLLQKKVLFKYSLFYSPRGYLLDVNNFKLLRVFNELIIEYIKNNNGFLLKIDPNVIYAIRDSEGVIKEECGKDIFDNFKKLNFIHLGFTKNFENLQPRNLCRIKLKDTYEETFNTFSKSTRKNITKTYNMGVRVRKIDTKEFDIFMELLNDTADMKGFIVRPKSYYEKMYNLMSDYITLYIVYIDTYAYYDYVLDELNTSKKDLDNLLDEMKKINIGKKLKTKEKQLHEKIDKYSKLLDYAKTLKSESKTIDIGALMSVFINNEGITFMSGTSNKFKEFNPKYAFYSEHIKDSIDKGLEYVNFYGISLDLNKDNPYYGIYEIKKGFNPEIIELLGEFDYPINRFIYNLYKISLKIYKIMKKFK